MFIFYCVIVEAAEGKTPQDGTTKPVGGSTTNNPFDSNFTGCRWMGPPTQARFGCQAQGFGGPGFGCRAQGFGGHGFGCQGQGFGGQGFGGHGFGGQGFGGHMMGGQHRFGPGMGFGPMGYGQGMGYCRRGMGRCQFEAQSAS